MVFSADVMSLPESWPSDLSMIKLLVNSSANLPKCSLAYACNLSITFDRVGSIAKVFCQHPLVVLWPVD